MSFEERSRLARVLRWSGRLGKFAELIGWFRQMATAGAVPAGSEGEPGERSWASRSGGAWREPFPSEIAMLGVAGVAPGVRAKLRGKKRLDAISDARGR
jgi:hypothetical protein